MSGGPGPRIGSAIGAGMRGLGNAPEARRTLADTVDDFRPVAISRRGPILCTDRGRLLEVAGGAHASCIVNDNGELVRRISARMLDEPLPLLTRGAASSVQLELAEIVAGLWGDQGGRVYFVSGGTEAIETAARLALHTQKLRGRSSATKFIGRKVSYHGMSLFARNVADHPVHSRLGGLDLMWPKNS